MKPALEQLLNERAIWRCRGQVQAADANGTVATGYPALDDYLPGAGWPLGQLLEIVSAHCGIGELRLIMPALASLSHERDGYIVWVAPPCEPYAPALAQWGLDVSRVLVVRTRDTADTLWATGEALSAGTALAVLSWLPRLNITASRRLQTAAARSGAFCAVYRQPSARREPSAANLRLALYADSTGSGVDVFKVRGTRPARIGAFETAAPSATSATTTGKAANGATIPPSGEAKVARPGTPQLHAVALRHRRALPPTGIVPTPLPG